MTGEAPVSCRLCGDAEYVPLYVVRGWSIGRCRACGLVQLLVNPDAAVLDDIYGNGYFAKGKYRDDIAGRREQGRRLAFMRAGGIADGARVLDLGMATGEFVGAARERYEMWGLDVAHAAVEQARAYYPQIASRMFAGKPQDAPLPEHYFDAVVMWDVIEHLDDPAEALRYAGSLLRSGGRIFLSTPNIGAPIASLMASRWHFMTPPEHITYFDRRTLEELCVRCGYSSEAWMTRGKWANVGFMLYKLRRVMPRIMPAALQAAVARSWLGRKCVYVPTGDIQYLAARRS